MICKKILAAVLMLSIAAPAAVMGGEVEVSDEFIAQTEAEQPETEQEQAVIEWSDLAQQSFADAGFSGTFFNIDGLGLELLVPEGLEQRQPTDEERETGTILVFDNEDKSQSIEFVLSPIGDCQSLEDVRQFLVATYPGLTVTPAKVNEYDTLIFGSESADSMTVLISAGEAGFLRIILKPIIDPDMNKLNSFVAASIQQIKE